MSEISSSELRKRNEELAKSYTYNTHRRVIELPDYKVKSQIKRSSMIGKLPKSKTTLATKVVKEKSKKQFKMPKLKFSGKGKRTAIRGKIR